MGLRPVPLVWMRTHYLLQNIRTGRNVVRVHLFELLGSSEWKWGVAGVWKIYPESKAPFSLYLLSCGICATEDTEAAGQSTVDSKYLYLQQTRQLSDSTFSPTTNSPTRPLADTTSHRQFFLKTHRHSPTLTENMSIFPVSLLLS